MYICDKHGQLDSEWCDDCQKIFKCDCSDIDYARYRDIHYDCKSGGRTATVWLYFCETCGAPQNVSLSNSEDPTGLKEKLLSGIKQVIYLTSATRSDAADKALFNLENAIKSMD